MTWWRFYFKLFRGTVRAPQVVQFLRHLLRHLPGRLLVIWDGLRQHRSRLVKELIAQRRGRLAIEFLPAYAPELNLIEMLWRFIKYYWLPFSAYASFSCLCKAVEDILTRLGTDDTITFQAA